MIQVLQNWTEIGQATRLIGSHDLPKHGSGEKCWDLSILHQLAANMNRSDPIVDFGYKGLHTLNFLHAMGFTDLQGVDLLYCPEDRLRHLVWRWRKRHRKPFYKLYRRNLLQTQLPGAAFQLVCCISVIEHGVDVERFLAEVSRILRPGGHLLVTTDYWQDKVEATEDQGEYGLPWKIFCQQEIESLIQKAAPYRLVLKENEPFPPCDEPCGIWHKKEYTFIALIFEKT